MPHKEVQSSSDIQEIILSPYAKIVFSVDEGDMTHHVFHSYWRGDPVTVSVVLLESKDEPLLVTSFQFGWLRAEMAQAEIRSVMTDMKKVMH